MNKRELILAFLVTASLIFTIDFLSRDMLFDCTQPLFSNSSSCSLAGGACVNRQIKGGFTGLFSHFTNSASHTENEKSGCKSKTTKTASVNQSACDTLRVGH